MSSEEFYKKANELIEKFCSSTPSKGFEIDYLRKACRIKEIYMDADITIEEHSISDPDELSNYLEGAYKEILSKF